jgi:integrase
VGLGRRLVFALADANTGSARRSTPKERSIRLTLHWIEVSPGTHDRDERSGRGTGALTRTVLPQANAYAMIRRRAAAAGIATKLGNHSFRATGITAYLKNGGTLEKAAAMANRASTRTRQLYDRRRDELSLDEVERIVI